MKGLLIGLSYAIKGLFKTLATAIMLPFALKNINLNVPFLTSGDIYYFINVIVGMVAMVSYTYMAKRYKYRKRDEPSKIYFYAENYYSKNAVKESNFM